MEHGTLETDGLVGTLLSTGFRLGTQCIQNDRLAAGLLTWQDLIVLEEQEYWQERIVCLLTGLCSLSTAMRIIRKSFCVHAFFVEIN